MGFNEDMYPVLQSRWKLEGRLLKYYGLRNYPYTLQRVVKMSSAETRFIKSLDGKTPLKELTKNSRITKKIQRFLNESIIVDIKNIRKTPDSLAESQYCTKCTANDFIIPGLEFDETGKCALCQAEENITGCLSTPMVTFSGKDLLANTRKNKSSRFDVALMYTGGKDSSFLLYYLARVCKLRVLACTWTIPFLSPNAKANIQTAREQLKNVEFIERSIMPEHLNTMYKASMELQGNTCLCPSLAYIVFYPLLVAEQVPYIISGIEEAQHKNLILNGFIPLHIYKLASSPLLHTAVNLFRIVTLRPPYKKGQLATITYLKQLAYGNNILKKIFGYRNEMVEHLNAVFNTVPGILKPFTKTLRKINRGGSIPTFVNMNLNDISPNQVYDWECIKKLLNEELGWQGTGAGGDDKGLHTSCVVEDGKDYSQYIRFRNMKSMILPFSAVELSTAVSSGNITREQAIQELQKMPGFNPEPPMGYKLMTSCDGSPCREIYGVK